MIDTKVKYYPTPMLGWRNGDTYKLSTYHVYSIKNLSDLTLIEAQMVADFMNRLKNEKSIRAVEARLLMSDKRGLNRLLYRRNVKLSLLVQEVPEDYLKLRIEKGAIVWTKDSILEEYENGII